MLLEIEDMISNLMRWVIRAERGERMCYHVGLLMRDRDGTTRECTRIERLAAEAWALHEQRYITLTQRRITPDECAYIATRTKKRWVEG